MESMGAALKEMQKRIDRMKTLSTTSTTDRPAPKCAKCNDTGAIHSVRWVEDETYTYKEKPMKIEVGTVEVCSCHYNQQFEKYNASLMLSAKEREHTFKNAVIDDENEKLFKMAIDFIKDIDRHLELGTWLYIFGDETRAKPQKVSAFGTGKTYMMQCIANALSHRKIPAIFINEEDLFGDIKATYDRGSEESEMDVLRRYYSVPVLMIDDLFSMSYKDWAEGKLFSILDARQKDNKITIITSNYAVGRIASRLPINGGKIASRITGQALMIELIGTDRRLTNARKRRGESA